jgi:photosystem II stability/assembly factor-like uncharacterized protein
MPKSEVLGGEDAMMEKGDSTRCLQRVFLSLAVVCGAAVGVWSQEAERMAPEGAKAAIGWAVGLRSDGYATILHTTDGGQIWERQGAPEEVGHGDLTGAAAVSDREAWVAGNDGGANGVLLHTRDGGEHWYPEGDTGDLSGNGLVSVCAVDLYTAWAVGANGLILHTTDGGGRWVRQGAGQVPPVSLQGVYAADATHAWVVGEQEEGKEYGTILRTADGGETWSKVPYTIAHNPPPSSPYLITVHGANANEVWAVGRGQIIHVSAASGGVRATDQSPGIGDYDINGIFAVNKKTVWAVADGSLIWKSINGGKGWNKRDPQGAGYVFRVSALDKKHAWVTTGDYSGHGQILYTDDGGKNWTPQPIPANPQMWGISFVK